MIKQFEPLTTEEWDLLLRAPALVSVLASCSGNEINGKSKADAVKLAHLRTYKAFPELLSYYTEVEKVFKLEFDAAAEKYYPFDKKQRDALKQELDHVNFVISKLERYYAQLLHKSLEKYATHVKKRHTASSKILFFHSRWKG
jgi:hypothetical protein